jgi:hypothetical protein
VIFPAFKAGDSVLRGSNGGFDSHTLPPHFRSLESLCLPKSNTRIMEFGGVIF